MEASTEQTGTILHWLRRYKPDAVVLHLQSGERRTVQKPAQDRGRWTTLERAILSMAPIYLEGLDAKGTVLASRTLEVDDGEAPRPEPVKIPENPMAALVASMPTLVQLIVDASDAAAARHEAAYRMSFEQNLSLVKVLADRLHGLEKAYQSVLMNQAAQQQEGGSEQLLATVLGGAMANGATNGAAKPGGTQ